MLRAGSRCRRAAKDAAFDSSKFKHLIASWQYISLKNSIAAYVVAARHPCHFLHSDADPVRRVAGMERNPRFDAAANRRKPPQHFRSADNKLELQRFVANNRQLARYLHAEHRLTCRRQNAMLNIRAREYESEIANLAESNVTLMKENASLRYEVKQLKAQLCGGKHDLRKILIMQKRHILQVKPCVCRRCVNANASFGTTG